MTARILPGKRTPDEEKAFRDSCAAYFQRIQPPKTAVVDTRGVRVHVAPTTQACPEPTCIDGIAYDPERGLIPCPVCGHVCPTCGNTGMYVPPLPVDHPGFGKPQLCPENCAAAQRVRQQHTERLYAGAKLPGGYERCTLETFQALVNAGGTRAQLWTGKMLAYYAVEAFIGSADSTSMPFGVDYASIAAKAAGESPSDVLPDVRNSLVLYGPHGVGKTGFAAAVVNALTPRGQAVRYTRTQDLIKAVQDRYGDDWRDNPPDDDFGDLESGQVVDVVRKALVLILDEFDMPDATTPNKQAIVENIIRYRCNHVLPTIITTNLDYAALEGRWGPTTTVVLGQRAHFIPVGGAPLRATPQYLAEVY